MSALERPVSDYMQAEVATLQRADRLDLADDIMRLGQIRHMPVLDGERVVGVISNRDLLAASLSQALDVEPASRRAFLKSVEVKEVMSEKLETARPDEPARDAARRMLDLRIGCLPVVDADHNLLGLLTETDLLRAALLASVGDVVEVTPAEPGLLQEELDQLRRMRDELAVRMHLGKLEARELWEDLEQRFSEVEDRARYLAKRAEEPLNDVVEAARLLIEEIKAGYQKLRDIG